MSALPPSLARWSESLAGIDVSVAAALGPMLHVLDDLVSRIDERGAPVGEQDGYDGTTNRGDPGRLLVAEWLLAEEVPLEFLRRAAENELSYLRLAHRSAATVGKVVAVCDVGPDQVGAGRLVQLAALVVLDARARAVGAELCLVIAQTGQRYEGPLTQILPEWLRSRSPLTPSASQLEDAMSAGVDREDRVWLIGAPSTRALVPQHRRSISSWISSWEAAGASQATIQVGNATSRLALPDPAAAVAALRGEGLLARRHAPALATVSSTGRGASFGSADTRLLWRGDRPEELYGCFVTAGTPARVRRYLMEGSVVAAASLGKRVVAAVTNHDRMWIQVVGKKLARTDRFDVSIADVGLDPAAILSLMDQPLRPLYLSGGQILLPVADGWWALHEDGADPTLATAVAPGHALDSPRQAFLSQGRVAMSDLGPIDAVSAGPIFGPIVNGGSWCTWSADTRVWRVAHGKRQVADIGVGEGEQVIGLCVIGSEPALIVTSASGRLLRQITPRHTKTWTRWAGPAHFDVHPMRPWLARTTHDRIVVGNLATGETLLEVRTATS